jgi:hypothetical protein
VCSRHKPCPQGSFDFVAAYVIPEDAWYIIPEKEIRGLKSISLCTVGGEAKYEHYRKLGACCGKRLQSVSPRARPSRLLRRKRLRRIRRARSERMEVAANFFKRYLERSNVVLPKGERG